EGVPVRAAHGPLGEGEPKAADRAGEVVDHVLEHTPIFPPGTAWPGPPPGAVRPERPGAARRGRSPLRHLRSGGAGAAFRPPPRFAVSANAECRGKPTGNAVRRVLPGSADSRARIGRPAGGIRFRAYPRPPPARCRSRACSPRGLSRAASGHRRTGRSPCVSVCPMAVDPRGNDARHGRFSDTDAYYAGLDKVLAGTGAFLTDPSDRVLLVKPNYVDHWGWPGGHVDAGETPEQACA